MKYWIFRENIFYRLLAYTLYTIVFEDNTCTVASPSLKGQFPLTVNPEGYWIGETPKTLTDEDIAEECKSYKHLHLLATIETDQPLTWDFLTQQHPELLL